MPDTNAEPHHIERLETALHSLQSKAAVFFAPGYLDEEFGAIRFAIEKYRDPSAQPAPSESARFKPSTAGINSTWHAVARFARS